MATSASSWWTSKPSGITHRGTARVSFALDINNSASTCSSFVYRRLWCIGFDKILVFLFKLLAKDISHMYQTNKNKITLCDSWPTTHTLSPSGLDSLIQKKKEHPSKANGHGFLV